MRGCDAPNAQQKIDALHISQPLKLLLRRKLPELQFVIKALLRRRQPVLDTDPRIRPSSIVRACLSDKDARRTSGRRSARRISRMPESLRRRTWMLRIGH